MQLADVIAAVALYMAVKDYNKQVVRRRLFCINVNERKKSLNEFKLDSSSGVLAVYVAVFFFEVTV